MLRSNACNLGGLSPEELVQKGEHEQGKVKKYYLNVIIDCRNEVLVVCYYFFLVKRKVRR